MGPKVEKPDANRTALVEIPPSEIIITERGLRENPVFGSVLQLKVFTRDYRTLSWGEVWTVFAEKYPGKWAVQFFPPRDQLLDAKPVYHLFVLPEEPKGLNLR